MRKCHAHKTSEMALRDRKVQGNVRPLEIPQSCDFQYC